MRLRGVREYQESQGISGSQRISGESVNMRGVREYRGVRILGESENIRRIREYQENQRISGS
jgi:hypothetical protein